MKLKNLQISNFRCFDSLSLDLDEQLTVLVAKNGQGKSSVLDAIRIGLWPFVSGFDLARNPGNEAGNNISIDDVRMVRNSHNYTAYYNGNELPQKQMVRKLPCEITLEGNLGIELSGYQQFMKTRTWKRFRNSEAKGTKTRDDSYSEQIKYFASLAQDQVRSPDSPEIDLPVFGYYGTGRLWSKKRLTEKKGKQDSSFYMRLFGYRDCLDPASSYKHFADWFTWISECYWEDKINQSKKGLSSETDSVWANIILVMQQVTNTLLHEAGWHTLEYSVENEKSLVLKHDEHGTLKVELLSDGIRGVLAMVGDIAYRCIKLNPHLGLNAAKETSGVVMIDEVDMHLHPAWQQTILGNLCKAFPKIQFIVTTHSPQVLTTVKHESIRLLFADGEVLTPSINTYGEESKVMLEDLMHVSSRPHTDETDLLQRYLQHINQGDIDSLEVKQWRQTLEQSFGSEYSKLKLADMVISKWKAKREQA
jgi:predicted ATP-binding protein involved in virulence